MTDAEKFAQRLWELYVVEARKRARMEGDVNFSLAEKVTQQVRVDAAFRVFRDAFCALDAPPPAIPEAPNFVWRLLATLFPSRDSQETSR